MDNSMDVNVISLSDDAISISDYGDIESYSDVSSDGGASFSNSDNLNLNLYDGGYDYSESSALKHIQEGSHSSVFKYSENNQPTGYMKDLSADEQSKIIFKYFADDELYSSFLMDSETGKSTNANLTVVPSQSSYKYGSDVRLNIRLFDNQTPLSGVVLVTVNNEEHNVNVTDGSAFLIISGLENNTYSVMAQFIGNDLYESVSYNEATIVVNKSRVVTGNATVTENASYGEDVVINIFDVMDVDGKRISLYGGYQLVGPKTPYGSFYLSRGKGSFYFSNLPVGNYSIYIVLGNNIGGTYELPTFILNFTVVKAKANLSVDVDSADSGEGAVFNIDLKDNEGYGVEITDINNSLPVVEIQYGEFNESVTLDMGKGTLNDTDLPDGIYDAVAIFKETDFYEEAVYEFSFRVGRDEVYADCSIVLDELIRSSSEKYGDSAVFLLKDQYGNPFSLKNVTIVYDGIEYNETTDFLGKIRLNVSLKNNVPNEFRIIYAGDDDYKPLLKDFSFVVTRKNSEITIPNKVYKLRTPKKVLTASFKLDDGKAIVGKLIKFTINGETYLAKTNSKGQASVRVSLTKRGTYDYTVEFSGDESYAPVSKSAKIVIK